MAKEAVCLLYLFDSSAFYHLAPIAANKTFDRLWVVRPKPLPEALSHIPNISYCEIPGAHGLQRVWNAFFLSLRLAKRKGVRAVLSFNAFPYGLIACFVGMLSGKPVHLGFIGSDWDRHAKAWYGALLDLFFKRAQWITVPGRRMQEEMIKRGYDSARIQILPHAVDVDRFRSFANGPKEYDCIFVGKFLPVKRVDRIVEAIAQVKKKRDDVRAALVGFGPLESVLKEQIQRLGLSGNISMEGYQADTGPWYGRSKMVLLASEREGFPFVLVEGMCAGAVPVAMNVGSVGEYLQPGKNALIVEAGDVDGFAGAIESVLTDNDLYESLKKGALEKSEQFRFDHAEPVWRSWFSEEDAGRRPE